MCVHVHVYVKPHLLAANTLVLKFCACVVYLRLAMECFCCMETKWSNSSSKLKVGGTRLCSLEGLYWGQLVYRYGKSEDETNSQLVPGGKPGNEISTITMATRWCSLFRNRKFKPQRQRSIDVETAMEHERQPENPAIPSKTTAQGLSFVIGFDEPAKKTTRAPKRRHTRPQVSEASLEEKQRLAEERRKVLQWQILLV